MQTQSIQSQQPNKPQAPKSAPLPNPDFKNALALEMDRAPVCAAPEQPAPAPAQARPPKNAQGAKPAQQAQNAAQAGEASQAGQAEAPSGNEAAAGAQPVTDPARAQAQASDEAAETTEDTMPAADPAAGMLAMLAAYGQLARPEPKTELPDSATGTGADAAALQADAAGKGGALADLAADARTGKPQADGTAALRDALSEQVSAQRLQPDAGTGLAGDEKAAAFAAKLAANVAANLADTAPAAQPVALPAAQALAATVQAANAAAASGLQARVGSNAWEQQLGQKVVWMVAGGDQSASLTLNPPDLGPLQVVLSVSNDSATATFTAHQAETRQAIENALPKLREMMSEAGIMLGDASVSAGSQEQQQAFAEQARGGGGNGNGRYGNGGDGGQQEESQPVIRRAVLGAVDTFA